MAHKLEIVRGTSNVFGISVKNEDDGTPYNLSGSESLVFGLKRGIRDESCVLVKPITHKIDDVYYLELKPEDTAGLEHGLYHYDIGLQSGEHAFFNVIPMNDFMILPNAAKCGDV